MDDCLPMDATPDEEDTDESSAALENEIRQVNRKLEMQPSPSSSLAQSREEAMCSLSVEKTHRHVEQTVRKVFKKPMRSKNRESHAIFRSMDETCSDSRQKQSVNQFGQFLASQQLKRKVEVCVKNQSQDELRQLYQEMRNEGNLSLRDLCGTMPWSCNQMDAKRACAMTMLQSSLTVATVRNLMKSNRIFKEMKSDMRRKYERVHAHRDEKLAVVVWSVAAMGQQERLVIHFWFPFQKGRQREPCKMEDLV